jgi:catechol 2,3-dioxygenase-like lactoylglutathione lyase family enzyme
MASTLQHAMTKFHVSLNVTDLPRALAFYRTLFGLEPAKVKADYAKFELVEPPLIISLVPVRPTPGGTVNHIGIRLATAAALNAWQARLEAAGMDITLETNVQCCHAVQSKFWVTDPERTLWEFYVFHHDVDDDAPAGAAGAPAGSAAPRAAAPPSSALLSWQHRLSEPMPSRIPHDDNHLDVVALNGTLNMAGAGQNMDAILGEAFRALKPGGLVTMHVLTGDRPSPEAHPRLPGPAAVVAHVPHEAAPLAALARAGFARARFDKLAHEPCFVVAGVRMRETRIAAVKPGHRPAVASHQALYLGPFAQVADDFGNVYPRGKRVAVNVHDWQQLAQSQGAEHFQLLGPDASSGGQCGASPATACAPQLKG